MIFLNEMANCPSGKEKILIAFIMHEILLSTYTKTDDFVRAFGDRLKQFVDQIAYFLILFYFPAAAAIKRL